ncbi:hypothetical protein INT47_010972 [Mucor saturninus]|uniref:Uncharacterized protein n=1 Tax=Mucor saturninus TaxID=64648 RepID=A0A8H7QH31_9FUNG|nr:hypothetical protein INT47_010972 [Mucor saturninus]
MNNFDISKISTSSPIYASIMRSAMANVQNSELTTASTSATVTAEETSNYQDDNEIRSLLNSANIKMDSLENQNKTIASEVGDCKTSISQLEKVIDRLVTGQISIKDILSGGNTPARTIAVASLVPRGEEPYVVGKRYPKISKLINGYIKHPNFTSDNPVKIMENDAKQGWSLTSYYNSSYNNALAIRLITYLGRQEAGKAIPLNDLAKMVKNHFVNQVRQRQRTPEAADRKRLACRRRQRTVTILRRRIKAYNKYRDQIDREMGRKNCDHALQKETMSEDETDGEDKVKAFRPSWRSDELQTFIDLVDDFASQSLKKKGSSILKRVRVVRQKDVPKDLAVPLAAWTINNE